MFLAPEGKFSRVLSFYSRVLADEKGHFEMEGIHPGTYRIYAFEELSANGWQDPEFLKQYAGRGEAVTLAEGQTAEAKPKLIRVGEGGGEMTVLADCGDVGAGSRRVPARRSRRGRFKGRW